eukprot:836579-Rhodomonas_salina.4
MATFLPSTSYLPSYLLEPTRSNLASYLVPSFLFGTKLGTSLPSTGYLARYGRRYLLEHLICYCEVPAPVVHASTAIPRSS